MQYDAAILDSSPSYDSPWSIENAQTYSALFMHFVIILWLFPCAEHTWHNILLAEEVSHCPLGSSRWDIIVDRAGVQLLAACSIMMRRLVTFSHDTMKLFRIVRYSEWENILSCKGSNPCSVNYNILPVDIGQPPQPTECWEEPEYNDKMHEKCGVGLCILGC
jgi:hypothetical protein